ncbi:hypothetical protein SAMN04488542_104116 [Fontibacillus panacisegetis]|uniref:Uncharacterized protein n=1 Tax=Fontibacillus panacisegetis TaxID=670482 RepID=A0A1G7HDC0_9BACL|nr:hypothetical protein [Fontibacillus panacisegetis]SDE98415.1 hypothetical protein SAMN04488542_104116 [Fontibacillus panacisegetis]
MLGNSLLTSTLLKSINQRQTDNIVDTVARNKKLNLSNAQVDTFKDVLSTELKAMYSKQQLLSSYLNTADTNSSLFNPYLSSFGQQSELFGGIGLYSPTSLSNLMLNRIIPSSIATNAYARQIFNNGNVNLPMVYSLDI